MNEGLKSLIFKRTKLFFGLFTFFAFLFLLPAQAYEQAAVATDKLDYSPGETAIISGTGWAPGETVQLEVICTGVHPDETIDVVADSSGNFGDVQYAITWDHLGEECVVTATGQTSGRRATTTFTDAVLGNLKLVNVTGVNGACVAGPSNTTSGGNGVQAYDVMPGGTYMLRFESLTPVDDCLSSLPQTVTFFLSDKFGKVSFTATKQAGTTVLTYVGTVTIAAGSCQTSPIKYCGTAFGQADNFVRESTGTGDDREKQSHLRAAVFPQFPSCVAHTSTETLTCLINGPTTANAGTPVTFTAPANPPDAFTSMSYSWSVTVNNNIVASQTGSNNTFTFTPATAGTYTINLIVSNSECGTNSCSATLVVNNNNNNTPPDITCPANISVNTDPGECSALVSFSVNVTGSPTPSVSCTRSDFGSLMLVGSMFKGTFPTGTTTVTCTATNGTPPDDSCSFSVSVMDKEAPTISCPAPKSAFADANCKAPVPDFTAGAIVSDNCPAKGGGGGQETITTNLTALATGVTLTQFPTADTLVGPGETNVTVTATDAAGNSSSCSTKFTVVDNTSPTITCPDPITVSADAQCQLTVPDLSKTVMVFDNCKDTSGVTVTQSPEAGMLIGLGETSITVTATDAAGNQSSCTTKVTVVDKTPPMISCPASKSEFADANCKAAVPDFIGGVTVSDNCPASAGGGEITLTQFPTAGTLVGPGETNVTVTATDAAGNSSSCSTKFTVVDNTPPMITCPGNIIKNNDPGVCGAVVTYTAPVGTDNCFGATTVQISGLPSGSLFPIGTTTNTFKVTDAYGNMATCSFTVTVVDNEKPVIACPANITVDNAPGQCGAVVNFAATATDNCPDVTVSYSKTPGSFFPIGTTMVTATATDKSGNFSNCTFSVTVKDNEKPVISCPANIVVSADPNQCAAQVNYTVTATDNCPNVTIVTNPPSGSIFPVGTTTVTSTATDAAGNTSTCTFTVKVVVSTSVTTLRSSLGQASDFAVLGLESVTISSGGVMGNVGVRSGTGSLLKSTLDGDLVLDPNAKPDLHEQDFIVTGDILTQDLTGAVNDALAASAKFAAMTPTQTFGDITNSLTIKGINGTNVISVRSINLVKNTLTLSGDANDLFIINVTSPTADFILSGTQIKLSGGLIADNVVFNFAGTGGKLSIFKDITVANGIFLAPQREIVVDNPPVNGAVIGANVTVHSGAQVNGGNDTDCACTSTIQSNFNGTQISAGNYVWFNSVFKASGLGSSPVKIRFSNVKIQFIANGITYNLPVPDGEITFDPSVTTATTTFDTATNKWVTTTRPGLGGNTFLTGLAFKVPVNFSGGINPVKWTGTFFTDAPNVTINWQWAAAVYTNFSNDPTALGVKPVDDNASSVYKNSDHAGTPENFKSFVIGGARGGGGSNFTGSYSGTKSVVPCVFKASSNPGGA